MKVLRVGVDLDRFLGTLAEAPGRLLMLDYDGTLAPFTEARDRAVPYPGVRAAIAALVEDDRTRVVVVSGRALDELRPLLAVEPEPEMWGSHGWERFLPGSGEERGVPDARAQEGLRRAEALARARIPADRVEGKPASVAVHVRGRAADEARSLLDDLRAVWGGWAAEAGLELHDFDGGLELRVPGRDKGTSVETALADSPPGTVAAFLGDDRTDEDAFRALGGRGLRVLVRDRLRETEADLWLRPPGELLDFLERWNSAARAE